MHPTLLASCVLLIVLIRLLFPFLRTFSSPLRSVPGPWPTRLSRLWYLRRVYQGTFHHENIALHRKYGPIVRVAPDMYSISSPDKAVYGHSSKFPKSDWYEGWKHPSPDRWTLFPDQDIKRHNETRRRFQSMYSMSTLVGYEGYVNICTDIFSQRLSEFAASGQVIDMAHWFQCYSFDVIGEITYSRRFGFLDDGRDVGDMLAALHRAMVYGTCVGIYAWAHPYLYSLTEKMPGSGAAGRSYLMQFVRERIAERNEERKKRKSGGDVERAGAGQEEGMPQDFLDKISNAHEEDPDKVTDYHIFMMNLSNIIAGSDTTAVSLSSILYHLLRFPRTMEKLRAEIAEFEGKGKCGSKKISFAESQEMPYLQAVIKEGLRLHAATGLPLWRVVPEGGAEICGQFFPAGTTIGLNTWVAHFDTSAFGEDAEDFRPERWIEAEKEGGEKLKSMESYYMPFGLGSRTCLGRHISILEMSKLIPQLVRTFDFELEQPSKQWKTENYWFVKPVDFRLRVRPRDASNT